ncbi:hypothetical protein CVT24_000809 [Panaeolus cyanescens]|uniref:endo-1,4-beta-xylanase n=1 Tax=Panaeolus cyanescens TaxID=181874 RepID=A0A409WBI1_9AGAR|nr:hypothetical protein CVT24_000809 [Panaeolus cyanescens]
MLLQSLLIATALSVAAFASPAPTSKLFSRASTPNVRGVDNGFFYVWWTDGGGNATYVNGPSGSYSVEWANSQGDFYGGKGWSPASSTRIANYEGTYEPTGTSYLGLYGFNKSPYGDYHVLESYGPFNPAEYYPIKGKITCDGSTYDVIDAIRIPPGLDPITHSIFSVRNPKLPNGQVSGSIDLACHLKGWASVGLNVEISPDYQIIATEGYFSSGYSNITVS